MQGVFGSSPARQPDVPVSQLVAPVQPAEASGQRRTCQGRLGSYSRCYTIPREGCILLGPPARGLEYLVFRAHIDIIRRQTKVSLFEW